MKFISTETTLKDIATEILSVLKKVGTFTILLCVILCLIGVKSFLSCCMRRNLSKICFQIIYFLKK